MSKVNNNNDEVVNKEPGTSKGRQRRLGHYAINQVYDAFKSKSAQPKLRRHTHHTGPTPAELANSAEPSSSSRPNDLRKRVLVKQSSVGGEPRKLDNIVEENWNQNKPGSKPRGRAYSTPDTTARDAALQKYYIEKFAALKKNLKKEVKNV